MKSTRHFKTHIFFQKYCFVMTIQTVGKNKCFQKLLYIIIEIIQY